MKKYLTKSKKSLYISPNLPLIYKFLILYKYKFLSLLKYYLTKLKT